MTELYRDRGLEIYEKSHYSHGEHIAEVKQILSWYRQENKRILDMGCSGGLHAIELAKRGFSVTGVDIEPSAIEVAKKRAGRINGNAKFKVVDIENDDFSHDGKFDLIYSIGNVMSHIRKDRLPGVFKKVKKCLDEKGTFLFDVLINEDPFREKIYPEKNGIQIIWKRKIDEKTGRISMDGIFLGSGFTQHFDVWGYTVEEMAGMLRSAGFGDIEYCENLDFTGTSKENRTVSPVSLYFRAKVREE